jgi:hypothetical protein
MRDKIEMENSRLDILVWLREIFTFHHRCSPATTIAKLPRMREGVGGASESVAVTTTTIAIATTSQMMKSDNYRRWR